MFERRVQFFPKNSIIYVGQDYALDTFSVTWVLSLFGKHEVLFSFIKRTSKGHQEHINISCVPEYLATADFKMVDKIVEYFDDDLVGWRCGGIFMDIWISSYNSNKKLRNKIRIDIDLEEHRDLIAQMVKIYEDMSSVNQQNTSVSNVARQLPGMDSAASCPHCGFTMSIYHMIQHLNDTARWSREKIADWLDNLQDNHGYDFTFGVDDDSIEEVSFAWAGWKDLGYIKEDGV